MPTTVFRSTDKTVTITADGVKYIVSADCCTLSLADNICSPPPIVDAKSRAWPNEVTDLNTEDTSLFLYINLPLPANMSATVTKVIFRTDQEGRSPYTVTLQHETTVFLPEVGVPNQCLSAYYSQGRGRNTEDKAVGAIIEIGRRR